MPISTTSSTMNQVKSFSSKETFTEPTTKQVKFSNEPTLNTKQPKAKQVTFSSQSILIVTQSKTKDEQKATWYSKDEMKQFKQNKRELTKFFQDTQLSPNELENV
jgi:hypothetical protein